MTHQKEPTARAPRQGARAFASPGMVRNLAGLVAPVGVVAGIWGVAYDINCATQAKAEVVVAVHARPGAVLQVSGMRRSDVSPTWPGKLTASCE